MKHFTRIPPKEEYTRSYKPKLLLIGEEANPKVLKKISFAIYDKKIGYEYDLKRKLKRKSILMIFPVRIKQYSKKYRIMDIQRSYPSLKKKSKEILK